MVIINVPLRNKSCTERGYRDKLETRERLLWMTLNLLKIEKEVMGQEE